MDIKLLNADAPSEIAIDVISTIFEKVLDSSPLLWKVVNRLRKKEDWVRVKAERYVDQMERRYNKVKVLGMSEPVNLRDIYIRANVNEVITSKKRMLNKDFIDEIFRFKNRIFKSEVITLSALQVVSDYDKIIILGKPGAGKTTFLKRLVLHILDNEVSKKMIPIFVNLKDWGNSEKNLNDYIENEFDICSFPDGKKYVEKILKSGRAMILFDGLDEISKKNQERCITELKNFSDKYYLNKIFITCRIEAYDFFFENFKDVEIADFNLDQISSFISRWFNKEPNTAQLCYDELFKSTEILELGKIPLLLTMLCISFDSLGEFPKTRHEIYKESIEILLKGWDNAIGRRVKREAILPDLTPRRLLSMLNYIAFIFFKNEQYICSQFEWSRQIVEYLRNTPIKNITEIDGGNILRKIVLNHGIIVPRAKDLYSFSHLTIHEYFVAQYIIQNNENGLLNTIMEENFQNRRWREIFLLVATMLDSANNMHVKLKTIIDNHAVNIGILKYLNEISKTYQNGALQTGQSRVIANYYVSILSVFFDQYPIFATELISGKELGELLAFAHDMVNNPKEDIHLRIDYYFKHTLHSKFIATGDDLNRLLKSQALVQLIHESNIEISSMPTSFEPYRSIALDIAKAFCGNFNSQILSYLDANNLLISCLLSHSWISTKTRNTILNDMFAISPITQ